jgi:hypothetical protein
MRDPPIEVHRAVGAGQATAPGSGTESILLLGLPAAGDQYGSALPEVEYFRISGEFVG